jgi:hypothetical protein
VRFVNKAVQAQGVVKLRHTAAADAERQACENKTMVKNQFLEIEAVKGIVHAINECWRKKDYKGIGAYLADDVVIAPPGPAKRIHGRKTGRGKSYRKAWLE